MIVVVDVGAGLDHLLAQLDALGLEVGRDLVPGVLLALRLVVEDGGLHRDRDRPRRLCWSSSPTGHWIGTGVDAEALADRVDVHLEVGADLVHLVDERDARNVVLVGLAPDGLALRLDAVAAVEHRDRAVEHAQAALDLDREVDVAGRVDDVDAVADCPRAGRSRGVQKQLVAALVMVIPRSCSCTIQSIVAAPSWTSPIL